MKFCNGIGLNNIIDMSLDGKGTNVAGTQLATRQTKAAVPGREPDFLSWVVIRSRRSSNIGLALMLP